MPSWAVHYVNRTLCRSDDNVLFSLRNSKQSQWRLTWEGSLQKLHSWKYIILSLPCLPSSSPIKDREFGYLHFSIVTLLYPLLTPMPTPPDLDIFLLRTPWLPLFIFFLISLPSENPRISPFLSLAIAASCHLLLPFWFCWLQFEFFSDLNLDNPQPGSWVSTPSTQKLPISHPCWCSEGVFCSQHH